MKSTKKSLTWFVLLAFCILTIPSACSEDDTEVIIEANQYYDEQPIPAPTTDDSSFFSSNEGYDSLETIDPTTVYDLGEEIVPAPEMDDYWLSDLPELRSKSTDENDEESGQSEPQPYFMLPSRLSQICDEAFMNDASLSGMLTLSPTVTTIGTKAFYGCSRLTGDLLIPKGVRHIGSQAFANCSGMRGTLYLPTTIESIGPRAFAGSGLSGVVYISSDITGISADAFDGSNLTPIWEADLPERDQSANTRLYSFEYQDDGFFITGYSGSAADTLNMPNRYRGIDVIGIGDNAFRDRDDLTGSIVFPDNLQQIGDHAFYMSGFTGSLQFPDSVRIVSDYAFCGCQGLETNDIYEVTDRLTYIGDYAFAGCTGFSGSVLIEPSEELSIGNYAFAGCTGFTGDLSLYRNVRKVGDFAFLNCSNLTGYLTLNWGLNSLGKGAFSNCSGLQMTSNSLPHGTSSIPDGAYYCCVGFSGTLEIPDNITSIGDCAFMNCTNLTGVSISTPDSLQSIGECAFARCFQLNMSSSEAGVIQPIVGACAFYGTEAESLFDTNANSDYLPYEDSNGSVVSLYNPENMLGSSANNSSTNIDDNTFDDCGNYYVITGYTGSPAADLLLPSQYNNRPVTAVAPRAFYGRGDLTGTICIPTGIVEIGEWAFYGCSNLTGNLQIPDSMTIIGTAAFCGCSSLSGELSLGDGLVQIGELAFADCTGLLSTVYASPGIEIADTAFEGTDIIVQSRSDNTFALLGASLGNSSQIIDNGTYILHLYDDYSKCVNVQYASTSAGAARICVDPFNDESNEKYIIRNISGGWVTISPRHASGLYIAAPDGLFSLGSELTLRPMNDINYLSVLWRPIRNADGSYTFYSFRSHGVMDVTNGDYSTGNHLITWLKNGYDRAQSFRLEREYTWVKWANTHFTLFQYGANELCPNVQYASTQEGSARIVADTFSRESNEVYYCEFPNNDGYFTLSPMHARNLFVTANNGVGAAVTLRTLSNAGDNAFWKAVRVDEGWYMIMNKGTRLALTLDGSAVVGTRYMLDYPAAKSSQLYSLRSVKWKPNPESFRVLRQSDSKWKQYSYGYASANKPATLYSGGCGIFSLVNAICGLTGYELDPVEVAQYAIDNGGRPIGGTDPHFYEKFFREYGSQLGINYYGAYYTGGDISALKLVLAADYVVVYHANGHYMAIVAYESGKYMVIDSYPSPNRLGSGVSRRWMTANEINTTPKLRPIASGYYSDVEPRDCWIMGLR